MLPLDSTNPREGQNCRLRPAKLCHPGKDGDGRKIHHDIIIPAMVLFFFVFRGTVDRVYSIGSRGNDSNDGVNYCCIYDDETKQSVSQPMKMMIVVVHVTTIVSMFGSQILLNMKEEKKKRKKNIETF